MSTVFSRFSEDVVVLEVDVVIGNKGDVRMCCFGLGDTLIMLLKATRERRKERKRGSKDRKEGREGGRRFMTVLICESSLSCGTYRTTSHSTLPLSHTGRNTF